MGLVTARLFHLTGHGGIGGVQGQRDAVDVHGGDVVGTEPDGERRGRSLLLYGPDHLADGRRVRQITGAGSVDLSSDPGIVDVGEEEVDQLVVGQASRRNDTTQTMDGLHPPPPEGMPHLRRE